MQTHFVGQCFVAVAGIMTFRPIDNLAEITQS